MKNKFKWKVSAIVAVLSCLLSILFFVQPILGYNSTNSSIFEANSSKVKSNPVNGRIAYSCFPVGESDSEIYTINPDGTDPRRLTDNDYIDVGPVWSPDGTKIAFRSIRPDSNQPGGADPERIYTMNADGTDERCITTGSVSDVFPAWSHDGTKIAYSSYQSGNMDIYIMDADGNNKQRLTATPENEVGICWSLDDSEIFYSSDKNGTSDIYKMKINNRKVSQITFDTNSNEDLPKLSPDGTMITYTISGRNGGTSAIWVVGTNGQKPHQIQNGTAPCWSPDGKYLTFVSNTGFLCTMNADGTNPQEILNQITNAAFPSWGSDRAPSAVNGRIAFSSMPEFNVAWEIYTCDPNGNDQRRLTNNAYEDSYPTWSPDGTKIAFCSYRPEPNSNTYTSQIYIMNSDGSSQQCITSGSFNSSPELSHDGSKIAYISRQQDNSDIYIMDIDGENQQRLTSTPANESSPSWSPDDSEIVFSSEMNGTDDLYKITVDSGAISQITHTPDINEITPKWSPNSAKIVYLTAFDSGDPAIWVIDANGQNSQKLLGGGMQPSWSPDGKYVIFTFIDPLYDGCVFTMNPDGTNRQPVYGITTACNFLSWGSLITALTNVQPNTINTDRESTDSVITCNITLPADYDISLVDTSTIKMRVSDTEIFAQSGPVKVMDKNKPYIMVKFNRSAVINAADGIPGDYDISVSGKLTNGLSFKGYDVIKVVYR